MAHRLQPMGHTFILFLHSLALLRNPIFTSASKHLKGCHAGLDPASSLLNGCCLRAFIVSYALSKAHHTSPVVFSE
jgi:hypothetical protein